MSETGDSRNPRDPGDVVVGSDFSPAPAAAAPEWSAGSLATRTAVLQALLMAGFWIILGYWNARHAWLLEPVQQSIVRLFFWRELPILGLIVLVVLPTIRVFRLADEASLDVEPEPEWVDRILAFPRGVAILDMGASVALFFLGALQVRLAGQAPALEAAKLAVFGFVAGVLFGVASFLLLQAVIRPILVSAARRGATRSRPPVFPLTQKIVLAGLAIAFIVTGLFGQIALSWAQQFAEARAEERSRDRLHRYAAEAMSARIHDAASCRSWLLGLAIPPDAGTLAVMSSSGLLVATWPPKPAWPDSALIASDAWRESAAKLREDSMVSRLSAPRVATSFPLANGWVLVSLAPPDAAVLRAFLGSVVPVAVEIVGLSVLLAWAVGRGLSRPLLDLESRARGFGEDPLARREALPTTDDEIGRLIDSFERMEEEIRAIQQQLRVTERRAATAELLAGVAHEVRNPLFGITSTAAALEGELAGNDALAPHLAVIRKESERLARMMEEMLSLQRAPRRAGIVAPISPILERAAATVRRRFADRSPTISVDAPFDLEIANADAERLESVFVNLFENAVLAGDRTVRISCVARREDGHAAITVADDGPGLPAEVRDRVFEPFVTSRPGGTGIGLAICRQIVLEHDGTIGVRSPEGGPAVFSIVLPAA